MAEKDYYEALGLTRQASNQDIRNAYRRLAMKYHPDRNAQDKAAEKKFKEVKQAYEVLSDEQKRAAYDRFGHEQFSAGMGGADMGAGAAHFQDIFGDLFEDFFGGGGAASGRGARRRAAHGRDIEYPIELTLEEAAFGAEKTIEVTSMQSCGRCGGTGAEPGSGKKTCPACHGAGQVRIQQGFFSVQQTCPQCHGTGEVIEKPCGDCRGTGRARETKTLSVKIPAGIDERKHISLRGEGEAGSGGGAPGDLYIRVRIKPHKIFNRQKNNLLVEVPVSFATATLGGKVDVPSLSGGIRLTIPPGTQSGKQFRMRGKGIRSLDGYPGDLICRVAVETPVNLTAKQKDLLKEFDTTLVHGKHAHTPHTESWTDNIRRFIKNMKL